MVLIQTINEIRVKDFRDVRAELMAANEVLQHPALDRAITFLSAAGITWGEMELALQMGADEGSPRL
jgi:hypothetical protein